MKFFLSIFKALRTYLNSTGGSFFCQIYAKQSAQPAAQPISPTQYIQGPSFPIRGNYVPATPQAQTYPQTYQNYPPTYTQQGVQYQQGFQPSSQYYGGRFQDQGRPVYQQPYYVRPAYQNQNQVYRPIYRPTYQQISPGGVLQQISPTNQPVAVVNNGYQPTYQPGYQQNVYPIEAQKPVYTGPSYQPTQQVYQPMGPQDQGQCMCGLRKRVCSEYNISFHAFVLPISFLFHFSFIVFMKYLFFLLSFCFLFLFFFFVSFHVHFTCLHNMVHVQIATHFKR